MPRFAEEPKGGHPSAAKEAARRKITRITYWSLPFVIIFGVLNFFPNIPTPWLIAKVTVEIVFVVVYGVAVIRFSCQRDEYWREMSINFEVRRAEPADAPSMARFHVDTWRETYRGLMGDAVLDDPALLDWRERFWDAALTDPRYEQNTVAVASHEGTLIGIAMSGPSPDDADEPQQLYVLYAHAAFHGSGVGTALLDAVIDPTSSAALWVADPNPRAQAFYRKNGFVTDGAVKIEHDVREIRMVRTIRAAIAG